MNRRRRPRLTFYHLLASQIYTKYLGDPTKQNRTLCSQCYELKFRRTEGWQRGGSTGVCWQAHTGTGVSETMPQKQINKNIPRSLPLLHSDSKAPIIIYQSLVISYQKHDKYVLKNLSIENKHIKLYILKQLKI